MGDLPMQSDVYAMTDLEFFDANPGAPEKLDPDNPEHADWIVAWSRIRDDVVNRLTDKAFFEFFPSAPPKLNPNDPADSTLIDYWNDIHDQIYDGRPGRYNWSTGPPASADSAGATDPGGTTPPPVPHVTMDKNEVLEWVHRGIDGAEVIADVSEVVHILQPAVVEFGVAEMTLGGVIGPIAGTIIVLWATVEAFGAGRRMQSQEGFCYGVMWGAFEMADGVKQFTFPWAGDEPEELREAFYDGVAEGREKAGQTKVRNWVMLAVGYEMSMGSDETTAQSMALNQLWAQMPREGGLGKHHLDWPKPHDQEWPLPE